jgi:anti-sigma regulatory factor (Ser/Thr protein kinase)
LKQVGWLLRLELPSNPEILSVVRSAVTSLAKNMGFGDEESRALTRAVDEALANIICHAYGNRRGHPIEILCRRVDARPDGGEAPGLEILLEDHGPAVDCKKFCGRPLDDVRPGGLGMHFIQSGVDVAQYSRRANTNRLRLVKYLPAQTPDRTSAKGVQ